MHQFVLKHILYHLKMGVTLGAGCRAKSYFYEEFKNHASRKHHDETGTFGTIIKECRKLG